MKTIAERVNTLFSTRFLFVTTSATERGVETVFVQRLLQPFGFHNIGMLGATVNKRVDAHRHPFRVFMHQQFAAVGFRRTVTKLVHFAEFPAGINVQ